MCVLILFFSCCQLVLQAQQESLQQEQQEHRASYLEVQRLRAQLEVSQGRIHSQELELERLRGYVADQDKSNSVRHSYQLSELPILVLFVWLPNVYQQQLITSCSHQASADSRDSSVRRASLERQRLLSEASRLNQVLQAKDHVIRWV